MAQRTSKNFQFSSSRVLIFSKLLLSQPCFRYPITITLRQHCAHSRMHFLDRFQGPDHDLEVDNLAVIVPFNHVDAIDLNAVHLGLEFEYGLVAAIEDTRIFERAIAERVSGG